MGEDEWVEQGQSAKLLCALNGFNPNSVIRLEWFFNYRRKLDNSGKKELFLNNVESTRDEGVYTCSVTDSSISSSNSLFLPVKCRSFLFRLFIMKIWNKKCMSGVLIQL